MKIKKKCCVFIALLFGIFMFGASVSAAEQVERTYSYLNNTTTHNGNDYLYDGGLINLSDRLEFHVGYYRNFVSYMQAISDGMGYRTEDYALPEITPQEFNSDLYNMVGAKIKIWLYDDDNDRDRIRIYRVPINIGTIYHIWHKSDHYINEGESDYIEIDLFSEWQGKEGFEEELLMGQVDFWIDSGSGWNEHYYFADDFYIDRLDVVFTYEAKSIPPIANAGLDQSVVHGDLVTLDGSVSSDPDENYPLIYNWEFVSRPDGSSAVLFGETTINPLFIADLPGDYVVRLTVTDSLGLVSSPDEVLISTFNTPPVADAGPDQSIIEIGTLMQLDGTQSYDEEGDDITYQWTIISKPVGSNAVLSDSTIDLPTFIADVQGEYIIELVTSDNWASGNPDQVVITFENVVPVANAGVNQSVLEGYVVYLDGSGSFDANLDPLSYSWSIVSKPEGSLAEIDDSTQDQTSFIADTNGQYVISLTVNDGFVDSVSHNITVIAITYQDAVIEILQDTIIEINNLDLSVLKNKNMQNALTNKINSVLSNIDQGFYQDALDQLQNDILEKTNGCAEIGEPDNNDWIKDCASQGEIYPMIINTIELLEQLIQ